MPPMLGSRGWPVLLAECASLLAAARLDAEPRTATSRAAPPGPAVAAVRAARPPDAPAAPTPDQRVYGVGPVSWIYSEPRRRNAAALGTLRAGSSLRLRGGAVIRGEGCPGGFVAVEPFGVACLDRTLTRSEGSRYLSAMQLAQPGTGVLPFRYALSNGTPMYRRLPTRREWEHEERFLGPAGSHKPLSIGNRGHELLAEERTLAPDAGVPEFFADGGSASQAQARQLVRRQMPLGSMLAFTRVFEHEGRSFLLAADGSAVPADRVRPYRESAFAGVTLGGRTELPIAWVRQRARAKHRRFGDGRFEPAGSEWPQRSFVALDARVPPVNDGSRTYLCTRERDASGPLWIEERDATVVAARDKRPWGVGERDKWIVVSITRGTLVAYEGTRPVFATLVSPGAGGVPIRGRDPVKMSTTPLGVYRISFKHLTDTMSPEPGEPKAFWIDEVPYTQYFNAPFALHVAYWHESFGEPMSAGCVNVSPRDGRWLFQWTEPALPHGWNGVAAAALSGKGTFIAIER